MLKQCTQCVSIRDVINWLNSFMLRNSQSVLILISVDYQEACCILTLYVLVMLSAMFSQLAVPGLVNIFHISHSELRPPPPTHTQTDNRSMPVVKILGQENRFGNIQRSTNWFDISVVPIYFLVIQQLLLIFYNMGRKTYEVFFNRTV